MCSEKEFDVVVITGSRSPSKLPGVEYIYEPLLSRWEKQVLWFNTLRLAKTERFERLLRESDIVYIPRFAFPLIPHAKKLGKRVVVHLHDYIPISYTAAVLAPYEKHKHRITRDDVALECMKGMRYCLGVGLLWWLPRLARRWISLADKVICVSKRQAEIISDLAPELGGKVEVAYNPLPPGILNAEPRKDLDDIPTFLYIGGDSYVKGFHLLLQALNKLGKRGVKARFNLANKYSPQSLEKLRRLSRKYNNLDIQVLGRVEHTELLELHKKAWALVFPSIVEETFGYAVVEATLLGTVPVATKVGALPEIFQETPVSEYLCEPDNINELANKLEALSSQSRIDVASMGRIREHLCKLYTTWEVEKKILKAFWS
jgi:Glycosyltransferase